MKKLIVLMSLMLVVLMAVPAGASSIYGFKGLMYMPIGDTQPDDKYTINFQIVGSDSYISFDYGLWENLEIYLNMSGSNGFANPVVRGGFKARILREDQIQPSLALGIMNKDLFVVASKTIEPRANIRGHIGFGSNPGAFQGLFFGFNKVYNPVVVRNSNDKSFIPVTNFKLEYIHDQVNLGADVYLNDYFTVNLGIRHFRDLNYGFSYTSQF